MRFKILKLVKFDCVPARWEVTVEADGARGTAKLETIYLLRYGLVRDAFMESSCMLLPEIKNQVWLKMVRDYGAPEVRGVAGDPPCDFTKAIEGFLETAKEDPDMGLLRAFPGRDEDSRYFRFHALETYLKGQGIERERRVILAAIKGLGFHQVTMRIGVQVAKVWVKREEQPAS